MTNHIFVLEIGEADTVYTLQNIGCMYQARLRAAR